MTAPETAQPLKLEVGKAYRTRNGRGPVMIRRVLKNRFGLNLDHYVSSVGLSYLADGRWAPGLGEDRDDLIAEWDAPDADGWIRWSGGECPVPPETVVEVILRDSLFKTSVAERFAWHHTGWAGDIIAYRVVKPAESTDHAGRPNGPGSSGLGTGLAWLFHFEDDSRASDLTISILRQHSCALSCIMAAWKAGQR